ncbi:PREDICTED: probable E3 ubiquitin ligase SUD1 [Camelina sativa]|uniref:Probable E3 ubiquitin ligase SUD1 n=1 Tax=Camelina sativa TaxID=90675 RepID=A0ABM1QZG9_CAMSA|nr:PREDICTED: probable E3 ubiquitin ligase SUD1 [Camelina sativa]
MMEPRRPYDVNRMFLLYTIAEGSVVIMHEYQNTEDDDQDQRDNRFLPRIALMLVLAALSLFLMSTAFMALPILAGRIFSDSISFIMLRFEVKHDDLCAFWIGCYILRSIYISSCFVSDHIQKGRTDLLLRYILIRTRNGLLFSIWISFIPGLLGLLIDLMIIIPSRVPLNESPVYFLIQDWLIGVLVLHIWTFLALITPVSCFATKAWRGKFERIRNVGINRLPSMWLLRDVIGSIINTLLTTLSIPYLLAKALFPLLGYPQSINSAVERFIWPALLALITVWFMAKLTRDVIIYLEVGHVPDTQF